MTADASLSQIAAASPESSVWLHANAGSGKTKVLIDRVARLLLSGVAPQHVLCLTYTKAAAAEMQNRLFSRLGSWAMMPDEALQAALGALGPLESGKMPDIARARQLFALAIETPGGLRIQTIHSFCSSILRRFPLEAGVSPQFRDLDDRSAALLRSDIAQEIASGPDAAAFDRLAQFYTADDLDVLLLQIAKARNAMTAFLDETEARAVFGVAATESMDAIIADTFPVGTSGLIASIIPALLKGGANDSKLGAKLKGMSFDKPDLALLEACEGTFLTGKGAQAPFSAKLRDLVTKGMRDQLAQHMAAVDALALRIEAARQRRIGLIAAQKAAALHGFARHFVPRYEARKAMLGMLDFDDQITRAKDLLTDRAVAQWVLYRLDGGIDHILVDEAQDTAPDQWHVLERLTDAFMDGHSARNRARTIFVVGDMKQSIYSFQGADVAAFDSMKQRFRGRLGDIGQTLQECEMLHSFRSSPAILSLVDATFDRDDTSSTGGKMRHLAFFEQMPGRVELWPLIESPPARDDDDGFSPVDLTTDEHAAMQIGRKVAAWISDALSRGMQVPTRDGQRKAVPGDFLVLVRRRAKIFDAVISACKASNLPVAGADRMVLGDELAVRDLMALLSFLATDSDDLSLATVLRSPLAGLTEDQLYRLAHGRPGSLWLRLQEQAETHADVHAMLQSLRAEADLLRPYDLLERALTRHGGRLRLVARLGQESEDAIDELLVQALAYESTEVPSITGFLSWLTAGDVQVKRQMESGRTMIRVMTVHGAKGLEAPVVILPDTADHMPRDRDQVISIELPDDNSGANQRANSLVVWSTAADESPPVIRQEKEQRKRKQAQEDDRLLYVAMTRAQTVLVVGAAGKISQNSTCWHRKISAGMQKLGATLRTDGTLVHGFGAMPEDSRNAVMGDAGTQVPDWAQRPAPPPRPARAVLSPSNLGGPRRCRVRRGRKPTWRWRAGALAQAVGASAPA